jgi:alpha-D-xyloside xylohydrolase
MFYAGQPMGILRRYYDVTGYPRLPATWGYGPVIWRDEVAGEQAVREDLDTIRELDLATTGYWIDRPYAGGESSFDFDPDKYDDPAAMIAQAHSRGFRMALWHVPYIDPKDPATAALRAEAEAKGYFPAKAATAAGPWGGPIDYTNPEAFAWWQGNVRKYTDIGIEGFKLDYAQEIQVGIVRRQRLPWEFFHDGQDERTMHVWSQYLFHKMYAELLPEGRRLLACAARAPGATRCTAPSCGRATSTRTSRKPRRGALSTRTAPNTQRSAACPRPSSPEVRYRPRAFPFFASDTGGYRHSPPDQETYIALVPAHRAQPGDAGGHQHQRSAVVLRREQGASSPSLLDLYKSLRAAAPAPVPLHLDLRRAHRPRRPPDSAPASASPSLQLGVHPSDVYMLGDFLFVAPVVEAGATSQAP